MVGIQGNQGVECGRGGWLHREEFFNLGLGPAVELGGYEGFLSSWEVWILTQP